VHDQHPPTASQRTRLSVMTLTHTCMWLTISLQHDDRVAHRSKQREIRKLGLMRALSSSLRYLGLPIDRYHNGHYKQVWQTGVIPPDLKKEIILPIYNGKGSPKDCKKNYRSISLLSTPGKVFATVLLNKVRDTVEWSKVGSHSDGQRSIESSL